MDNKTNEHKRPRKNPIKAVNTGKPKKKRPRPTNKKKTNWRTWTVVGIIALLCLLLIAGGLIYVSRRMYRPNIVVLKREYPVCGIDVSSHNGDIDFRRVAADSITFVYIKASEGADFTDRKFRANCDSAAAAGIKVGAYHFFRKNGDGYQQANNFLDAVAGKMLDLPLAIDVEDWGNEIGGSKNTVEQNLANMIEALEKRGCRIIIYTNKDGYRRYIRDNFAHHDLWLCTFSHPRKVNSHDWILLQYSHWGNVDGVTGEVDLNVFNGDSLQWENWLRKR